TRRSSDLHHLGSDTSLADHPARTSVAAASGGGTAHDASRAVHGREERLLLECEQLVGFIRGNCTADDHGIIRHRSADEALLPREGRCCPFADDDHLRRYAVDLMRLAPREVVVIVDELRSVPPIRSTTLRATHSRPTYAYRPASSMRCQ